MFIRQAYYVLAGLYWERCSREKIEKRQLKKINIFLKNARSAVPYYQNQDIYAQSITSLQELERFPIILDFHGEIRYLIDLDFRGKI